ncbi:X-ray radiation resistance-associated protein 1 [Rhizophlyctis rosea]|uniref:X-ray radiation resistance-associated protein 1 n=1 Tax=Rhizophlyctis rosea TaxID=64517 RepID=A0AAD5S3K2_9FUNG|nr:X-ray radiation resistance-associated protein 1 [Rhizophlyctis rosea]
MSNEGSESESMGREEPTPSPMQDDDGGDTGREEREGPMDDSAAPPTHDQMQPILPPHSPPPISPLHTVHLPKVTAAHTNSSPTFTLPPPNPKPQYYTRPGLTAVHPKEFIIGADLHDSFLSDSHNYPFDRSTLTSAAARGQDSLRPDELTRRVGGKYVEIPHVLDGFLILNQAPAEDPLDVYSLDITSRDVHFVIEDDLSLFTNLHTLKAGENHLPFARLGALPGLRELHLPCNGVTDLDLECEGRFEDVEFLDLSYNSLTHSALLILATLPSLRHLDLSSNTLSTLPPELLEMRDWRDRVIELILPPGAIAALDERLKMLAEREACGERARSVVSRVSRSARAVEGIFAGVVDQRRESRRASAFVGRGGGSEEGRKGKSVTLVEERRDSRVRKEVEGIEGQSSDVESSVLNGDQEEAEDIVDPPAETGAGEKPTNAPSSAERSMSRSKSVAVDDTVNVVVDEDDAGSTVQSDDAEDEADTGVVNGSADEDKAPPSERPQTSHTEASVSNPPTEYLPGQSPEPEHPQSPPAHQNASQHSLEDRRDEVIREQPPPSFPLPSRLEDGPGFLKLESLVLENNRISTAEAFAVLGGLPK